MSYSIDEGITDHEQAAEKLKLVQARFPDAKLHNGRWCSAAVWKVATDVEVSASDDGKTRYFRGYIEAHGVRVYEDGMLSYDFEVLDWLKKHDARAYGRLVDAVARRAIAQAAPFTSATPATNAGSKDR